MGYEEHDTQARQRATRLEAAGKLDHGFVEAFYTLTRGERAELGRYKIAFALAHDLEACRDLLAGIPVDPARIDQPALEQARTERLVQLIRPIDVLERNVA